MFGAIPYSLYTEITRAQGAYLQEDLDLDCPPYVFVAPSFLCSVPKKLSVIDKRGKHVGIYSQIDHPSFLETREWLKKNGYVHCEYSWSNGDSVIKPFYFNNILMDVGDPFYSAAAMRYSYSSKYNDGNPLVYEYVYEGFDNLEDEDIYSPNNENQYNLFENTEEI